MKLFNSHVHTKFSHDSIEAYENLYKKAVGSDIFGFAITDHCDCEYASNPKVFKNAVSSFLYAEEAKQKLPDGFVISSGIEMGDALFNPDFAAMLIAKHKYDVILGSVHAVRMEDYTQPFSTITFNDKSDAFIDGYLRNYFEDVTETLITTDFDVLSHLTVPIRYISKKYNRRVDLSLYYPLIADILKLTVEKGKALEINTSNFSADDRFFMPDENIIDMYINIGGKDFILGSDAHISDNINYGLTEAASMLKSKGVNRLIYYINREKNYYNI